MNRRQFCAGLAGSTLGLTLSSHSQGQESMQHYPSPPPPENPSQLGAHLQRTMTLLATSTPERRHKVKILFYGQSITKQEWSKQVADDLRKRFPHADLEIENRAIGGFAANLLKKPLAFDVSPFYPDLIIFHDYGGEPDYEGIIADIRRRTTAEMLLQSDHITWLPTGNNDDPNTLHAYEWHNQHAFAWLPALCKKYGLELAEIRAPWKRYLEQNHLQPKDLLVDGVHLNDQGNFLLAELIKPHLRYDPHVSQSTWQNLTHTYLVGKDLRWKNGKLTLEFEGNRVDAIHTPGKTGTVSVQIDGKKPSEFPELYALPRPNGNPNRDWPWQTGGILRVGHEKPLLCEDWTVTVTQMTPDAGQFTFDVVGSQTGSDGSGTNETKFVSKSGRVVIDPEDWWVKDVQQKPLITPGFTFRWRVIPQSVDAYQVETPNADTTREQTITLAQGLTNDCHTLELTSVSNPDLLHAVRVYRPPLR